MRPEPKAAFDQPTPFTATAYTESVLGRALASIASTKLEEQERKGPVQNNTKVSAGGSLERRLVELVWTDPAFAELLRKDPHRALSSIGVEVSSSIKIDVREQRRDTLYFVVPPLAIRPEEAETVIDQMDLWGSGDLFCWIMPQALKLELLRMRQNFRRNNP